MATTQQTVEWLHSPIPLKIRALTLLLALFGNLLPWERLPWLPTPDFLALAIVFWSIFQPAATPLFVPFVLGLVMDVASGNPLGHHAVGYVALSAGAQALCLRIEQFGAIGQTLHVLVLFLIMQMALLLVAQLTGDVDLRLGYWLLSPMLALLWPLTLQVAGFFLRRQHETWRL